MSDLAQLTPITLAPTRSELAGTILGHPSGLFVLFFTEMWERFSYYGMRAILVLFLITDARHGGWAWTRAEALQLYGWYTGLVYFTPLLGGYIADRWIGNCKAVRIGGAIIATGHACLLFDTPAAFYPGLAMIVCGTGLFKPNISALVGRLYDAENEELRDAGYTLFYMGVNSGAFFGTLLCGYLGETISWPLGFGLAGLFMFLGTLQFHFARGMFGENDTAPKQRISVTVGNTPSQEVISDRLKVIYLLSFFAIFFMFAYEQAGGSMTIFAAAYTDRLLSPDSGRIFKFINCMMSTVPAVILTWVMSKLFRCMGRRYPQSSFLLFSCLAIIWTLLVWLLRQECLSDQLSVPATWFSALPAFFIIIFAPVLSKFWAKYWNPTGPVKFGIGLLLLGAGFATLAYGSLEIPSGAKTAAVGMKFLFLAYWLHTMGELYLSPVGLSLISKLAPLRLQGFMFGIWFLNAAIAIKLAGIVGSYIDHISSAWSMASFFLIFAIVPAFAGLAALALNKWMVAKMHGVR